MRTFGLIGYPLEHSFSPSFFSKKFEKENINARYDLFPIEDISDFPKILKNYPGLEGLNVTIPYKESIIPYLDDTSKEAKEIEAVNTIKITKKNSRSFLKGFNTDVFGFYESLVNFLPTTTNIKALILGTGGAAKAVAWVLKKEGIRYNTVSRQSTLGDLNYNDLTGEIIKDHKLIINTTPLGMHPNTGQAPPIPYQHLTSHHFCYDLIYNPEKTTFLKESENQGAAIKNGLEMLQLQAEKSWEIWNSKSVSS